MVELLSRIGISPKLRTWTEVNASFVGGAVETKWWSRGSLTRYPDAPFQRIRSAIQELSKDTRISRIKVSRFGRVAGLGLEEQPLEIFKNCLDGPVLNLTRERLILAITKHETHAHEILTSAPSFPHNGQLEKLTAAIIAEADKFDALANGPSATVDNVFRLIDEGKGNLGILNVAVYRPVSPKDGREDSERDWILTQRTRHWTEAKGRYEDPHKPETTLKSIIDGREIVSDVDICDLESFQRAGVEPDPTSISNDLRYAKGSVLSTGKESRRLLYIKIQSGNKRLFDRFGVEGVILFHNQVRNDEEGNPALLLPENPNDAKLIKEVLRQFYIGKIVYAIEAIRERELERVRVVEPLQHGTLINSSDYDPEKLWHDLQRFSVSIRQILLRNRATGKKVPLEVMDLRGLDRPNVIPDSILEPLSKSLGDISSRAWEANTKRPVPGYSADYIFRHFVRVNRKLLARDPATKQLIAFSSMNWLEDVGKALRVLMYEVSMVVPEYQNMRISSMLVRRLFYDALIDNKFNPVTIGLRTAQPPAVGGLQILGDIFPSVHVLDKEGPDPEQLRVFNFVADFLNPNQRRHEDTFVIDDVYPMESGLIVPAHAIPAYKKDSKVDELCWNLLDFDRYNRPDFFSGELSGIALGSVISALNEIGRQQSGAVKISLSGQLTPEQAFNALLERTDLPKILTPALANVSVRPYAYQLTEFVKRSGMQADFRENSPDMQDTIKFINRMLLEDLFDAIPKRKAKALIMVGEASTDVKKKFDRKLRVVSMQDIFLSFLRRLAN